MANFAGGVMRNPMVKKVVNTYIRQWMAGDEQAFVQILDFYYPRLLSSSLKIVPGREDCEELVMNAMLKIWQYKLRLSEVRQFDDYLFGILRQETVGFLRKKVLVAEDIDDQILGNLGTVQHPELTYKELLIRYHAALNRLSPKQREVFLALREQDMSRKELARQAGTSVNTINSHMNSALKILREEMKEFPEVLIGLCISSACLL